MKYKILTYYQYGDFFTCESLETKEIRNFDLFCDDSFEDLPEFQTIGEIIDKNNKQRTN